MILNILRKKHSFKSDSDSTELHGESRETSLLRDTYSKEHVHKENWDYNRALKCPSHGNGNTSTVLKEEALINSEENKRKTKKRKSDKLEEIIPKKDFKRAVSETKYNCQGYTSSRLRNIHNRIITNCRTSTSKYRIETPDKMLEEEDDDDRPLSVRIREANSLKTEVKLRYHLRRINAGTDYRESLCSQDETDCKIPVKRRRRSDSSQNKPVTTGDTRCVCVNSETQPAINVHVNVIRRKRGRPRKSLPIELLTDKCEVHKELQLVPAPVEKEEQTLSPTSYNWKRGRPRKSLPIELLTDKREVHKELQLVPAPVEKEEQTLSPTSYNWKRGRPRKSLPIKLLTDKREVHKELQLVPAPVEKEEQTLSHTSYNWKRGRPRKSLPIKLLTDKREVHKELQLVPAPVEKEEQTLSRTSYNWKRGRPRKSLPIELLTDKREVHKELQMVPAPVEKEEQKLSPMSYNCKRYTTNTGYNITNSFAQITIAKSSDSVVAVNQNVVPYKNYTNTNKVSVIRLVRVEDMPLDQLSKLLSPKPPRQTDRFCYKEETQRSAYVSRTTKVERGEEILYHELVCKEQQINVIKEVDANVNRRTNRVDASSTVGILDGIGILKSNDNGYNSRFTVEDVLQLFLKSRNLTFESTKKSDSSKSLHTCAAMCNNCKQAFDMLCHFTSKANSKNENMSVECTPCDLQINLLSHLQGYVTNELLKCEGKRENDYPVYVVNFNKDLDRKHVKIIFACCCCSKVYQRLRFFEYHINKCHTSKIVVDSKDCQIERIVEDPQSYKLYRNVRTSDEDRASDRDQIFDIASKVNIYNRRRDVNLVNHKSIRSCINTRQVNITNSLYCDGSNSKSTMLEWTMQVREKNIILQGNNDSPGEIDETIQTAPTNKKNLNICETREPEREHVLDVAKVNQIYTCDLCSKVYKQKKRLSTHLSSYCKARVTLDEQRTEDTNHSNTSKTEEDSVDAGRVTNVHDRMITNSEEPSRPGTSGDTTTADGEGHDAGNQNVERANEHDALIENGDNQNLYMNLVENSEVATKVPQSFMFNVSIARVCKRDTKGQEETENESEYESPVDLDQNEEETDSAQESLSAGSRKLLCHECGKVFVSRTKLKDHMFAHDVASEDSESSNPLPEALYSDVHKKYVASRLRQNNESFEKDLLNQFFKKSKKWRCDDCRENFGLLRNYLRHMYDIHGDESVVHVCDNCNAILTSVKMVNLHVCSKVATWVCKRCSLYFPDGRCLMYHNIFSHFEIVGPHVCETCGSTFLTDYMLTKHRTKHSDLNYLYRNPASDTGYRSSSTSSVETQTVDDTTFLDDDTTFSDDDTTFIDDSREESEELHDLRKILSEMSIACVANSEEVIFKCNNCSTLRPTESAMIEHLIACCRLDRCQICYATEPEYKLMEHLIQDHMVVDCSHDQGNDVQEVVDINDIIKLLGFNRLVSLYEYQKFDGDVDCIECESCKVRFSDNQLYQFHYFKNHEDVCLLCNIKFKHAVQALEHKMKIHNSYHLYLWIVQMLLLAVSRVGHYGNTIEQVILKSSEIRMS